MTRHLLIGLKCCFINDLLISFAEYLYEWLLWFYMWNALYFFILPLTLIFVWLFLTFLVWQCSLPRKCKLSPLSIIFVILVYVFYVMFSSNFKSFLYMIKQNSKRLLQKQKQKNTLFRDNRFCKRNFEKNNLKAMFTKC